MPNFRDMTQTDWAQMTASTRLTTYEILDRLKAAPIVMNDMSEYHRSYLPELATAGWVRIDEGDVVVLTDAGRHHLDGF